MDFHRGSFRRAIEKSSLVTFRRQRLIGLGFGLAERYGKRAPPFCCHGSPCGWRVERLQDLRSTTPRCRLRSGPGDCMRQVLD